MNFAVKLDRVLGLFEAKKMLKDQKKPSDTTIVHGWQVLLYDDLQSIDKVMYNGKSERDNIKEQLPLIIGKLTHSLPKFTSADKKAILVDIFTRTQQQIGHIWHTIEKYRDNTIEDVPTKSALDDIKEVVEYTIELLLRLVDISIHNMQIINFDMLRGYTWDLDKSVIDNITSDLRDVIDNFEFRLLAHIDDLKRKAELPSKQLTFETSDGKRILGLVNNTLARIRSIGVRRSAAVPIRLHLVNEYPRSGYGTGCKVGDEDCGKRTSINNRLDYGYSGILDTHKVNVYITKYTDPDSVAETLAHEIGHVLFAINPEVQSTIAQMAHTFSSAPSDYGRVDYKYEGSEDISTQHRSGNEWMAEMFAKLVMGDNLEQFTQQQIKMFKVALATINGHPHAGIDYKLGQDLPIWQAVVDPSIPEAEPIESEDPKQLSSAQKRSRQRKQDIVDKQEAIPTRRRHIAKKKQETLRQRQKEQSGERHKKREEQT